MFAALTMVNGWVPDYATCETHRCGIMLYSFEVTGEFLQLINTNPEGLRIRGVVGSTITVADNLGAPLFRLEGDNAVVDNLTINRKPTGALVNRVFHVTGNHNTVMRNVVQGYGGAGVHVEGDSTALTNNFIVGNVFAGDMGSVGVWLSKTSGTRVVGNVVLSDSQDGILLDEANGTYLDHNTIVGLAATSGNSALKVTGGSDDLCMRNNNIGGSFSSVINLTNQEVSFNTAADGGCVDWIGGASAQYHNNNAEGATLCEATGAGDPCGSLPATLFSHAEAVTYVSVDPSDSAGYCMEAGETTLIDGGLDLGYDLVNMNRYDWSDGLITAPSGAGTYEGDAPDIGARESGLGGCP
jgi:parallel beta-helix repeat protein